MESWCCIFLYQNIQVSFSTCCLYWWKRGDCAWKVPESLLFCLSQGRWKIGWGMNAWFFLFWPSMCCSMVEKWDYVLQLDVWEAVASRQKDGWNKILLCLFVSLILSPISYCTSIVYKYLISLKFEYLRSGGKRIWKSRVKSGGRNSSLKCSKCLSMKRL